MAPTTEALLSSAQSLPQAERVRLIEALIAGLDEVAPALDEAQMAEIARRSAEVDAGSVKTVPWSEVRDSVRREGRSRG